jgi:quercetin dioxygenase-like cupin family protein
VGETPTAFEAWNDYDPSMRFITAFPISAAQGTASSTVAYYEYEPGRHSGLHSDNAEETIYVADGEGEVFISGRQEPLEAGGFQFIPAGVQHDVYAYGDRPLRLLSFFPTNRVETMYTEIVLPFGDHVITSESSAPTIQEILPDDLPPELAAELQFDYETVEEPGMEFPPPPGDDEPSGEAEADADAEKA